MPAKKQQLFVFVSLVGVLLVASLLFWTLSPVKTERESVDPAVQYFNEQHREHLSLEEDYFEFKGNTLHYVEGGDGEAVLFLHGFPSYWVSLSRQISELGRSYRVVALDGLGAGRSDAPGDLTSYELRSMAEHVVALLNELAIQKVHLVGHDWGSAFALALAQRYPERVLSVTAMSAPSLNAILYALEHDEAAVTSSSYVEQFKRANPLLLLAMNVGDRIYRGAYQPLVEAGKLSVQEGRLFQNATSDPKRINAHINWYRANLPSAANIQDVHYWPSRDARITVPALYLWGEEDPIYNETALRRLLALSDQPQLVRFPNVGHWPHVQESQTVNELVKDHLAAASNAGTDKPNNED